MFSGVCCQLLSHAKEEEDEGREGCEMEGFRLTL